MHKRTSRCRQDWFSRDHEAACGFQYSNGRRVFDSQVRLLYKQKIYPIY